jgi:predicted aminopeptidase
MMAHTILFMRDTQGYTIDPLTADIRKAARAEKWVGMAGFKQWAKETYNATLRAGMYDDWTSITFKTEQDINRFKKDFGVGL